MKLGLKILDFFNMMDYTVGYCGIKWVEVGAPENPAFRA
jgi:hypothetical protein